MPAFSRVLGTTASEVVLPVQFSNYYSNSDSRTGRALPELLRQSAPALAHVARRRDSCLKRSRDGRSSPSSRGGTTASEVVLPVQFSNYFLEDLRKLADLANSPL